jgi:hypothetical protein
MSRVHSRAEGTRPRFRGPGGPAPGACKYSGLPLLLIVAAAVGCRGASQDPPQLRAAAVDPSPRRDFSTQHTSPDAGALRKAPRSGGGGAQCDEIFVVSARALSLSPSLPLSLPPSLSLSLCPFLPPSLPLSCVNVCARAASAQSDIAARVAAGRVGLPPNAGGCAVRLCAIWTYPRGSTKFLPDPSALAVLLPGPRNSWALVHVLSLSRLHV